MYKIDGVCKVLVQIFNKGYKIVNKLRRYKALVKRCVSIFLAFIIVVTGMGSVGLKTEAIAETDMVTLYFIDNTSENWIKNDDAVIQLVDNTNGHICYDMVNADNNTWWVTVPESACNITFNRFNSDKSIQWNSWSAGGRGSDNAYYAEGAEYGHWDVAESENAENYFHVGDIVYLDI